MFVYFHQFFSTHSHVSICFDWIDNNLSHTPITKHSQESQWSWKNLPDSLPGFMGSNKGNICCWLNAHHMLSCSLSDKGETCDLTKCILTIRSALEQSTCCVSIAKVAHMGRPLVTAVILKIFCPPFGYITPLLFPITSNHSATEPCQTQVKLRDYSEDRERTKKIWF